jgi:hypothetical protein
MSPKSYSIGRFAARLWLPRCAGMRGLVADAMYAAVACTRAAASRVGVPVRQACQDLDQSPGDQTP